MQFTESVKMALEREVDAAQVLDEVRELMLSVGRKTYREMATIDQRLRGKGDPESAPLRNCDKELQRFSEYVEEHYAAEVSMLKQPNRLERWYSRNKGVVWVVGGVGAALAALAKVVGT